VTPDANLAVENPRVGGSIPPLATTRVKVLVKNDTDSSSIG
jgi:hypothetical protein